MHFFCFINFFQFSKEVLQNGQNVAQQIQNSTIFNLGVQNSHEIKKVGPEANISSLPPFGHVQHECVGQRPTPPSPTKGL